MTLTSSRTRRAKLLNRSRSLFLERLEDRSLLATIVVTGTGDTIAVDGVVTLREAITAARPKLVAVRWAVSIPIRPEGIGRWAATWRSRR